MHNNMYMHMYMHMCMCMYMFMQPPDHLASDDNYKAVPECVCHHSSNTIFTRAAVQIVSLFCL